MASKIGIIVFVSATVGFLLLGAIGLAVDGFLSPKKVGGSTKDGQAD